MLFSSTLNLWSLRLLKKSIKTHIASKSITLDKTCSVIQRRIQDLERGGSSTLPFPPPAGSPSYPFPVIIPYLHPLPRTSWLRLGALPELYKLPQWVREESGRQTLSGAFSLTELLWYNHAVLAFSTVIPGWRVVYPNPTNPPPWIQTWEWLYLLKTDLHWMKNDLKST